MTHTIDPERLKTIRKSRGLTQDELAKKARLDKQTIYRLERGEDKRPVRRGNLDRLAEALGIDPEVLAGEKPIPPDIGQASAPPEETAYQLNVRVDAPIRNAFELVARRYRVSVAKIAKLAPLLFVIVAEASLKHRRKKLDEFLEARERISEIESNFPDLARGSSYDQEEVIDAEKASIESRDLFGLDRYYPNNENDNPFVTFLKALIQGSDDNAIRAVGPTSTEYQVCRSVATELAGGDDEVARWLLDGEVQIHRIPRGLKNVAERVVRMREHRISIHHEPEDSPKEYPADLARPSIEDLLAGPDDSWQAAGWWSRTVRS